MYHGQHRGHSLQLGLLLHNTLQWTPCGSQLHGRYVLVGVMHQLKKMKMKGEIVHTMQRSVYVRRTIAF
jgi:hypothetical protein